MTRELEGKTALVTGGTGERETREKAVLASSRNNEARRSAAGVGSDIWLPGTQKSSGNCLSANPLFQRVSESRAGRQTLPN